MAPLAFLGVFIANRSIGPISQDLVLRIPYEVRLRVVGLWDVGRY